MVEEKKSKPASVPKKKDKKETESGTAARISKKGGEKEAKSGRRPPAAKKRKTAKRKTVTPRKTTAKASVAQKKPGETKPPEKIAKPLSQEKPSLISPQALAQAVEREYSPEEFNELLKMYETTLHDIREGEIIKGKVMGVTKEDVIVDVGFKSEGIIPLSEFSEPVNIKVADEIEVFLDAIEDQDGQLVLSKQKADFMRVWEKVRESHDKGELIEGKIMRRIKGGMVVDLLGVDAFLPGSQIALKQIPDFDALLGQTMQFKVIKLNKARRNIVVSRRVVLEEERQRQREKLLTEVQPGQIREGVVKNITDFGVFIDLGGVDGLLHITDMSWGRISHPSELVALGDKINVKILDFDKSTGRISLGLKQLTPYPWENIEKRYPAGKRVKGKVVSITDYGAFVELEKGVEGLIHISEMSWTQHIKHPSKLMGIGDVVEAAVLSVDKENEKISLGIKQLEPDPWENIEEKYKVGSKVSGRVRNLTAFGAFLELEEGIDGLIHISDMSWTKRIQHPSELIRKGERIEVVVLNVDKENRRISLGYKQLQEDPWPELSKKFAVNKETTGKILRLLDRGVIVDLGDEVEGFVPTNHLGKPEITRPIEAFNDGDEIPLKVIEFDRTGKRIVLSVDAYYRGREKAELDAFLAKHPTKTLKVEEIVEERPKLKVEKKPEEKAEEGVRPAEPLRTKAEEIHRVETEDKPTSEAGDEKKEVVFPQVEPSEVKGEEVPKPETEEKPKGEVKIAEQKSSPSEGTEQVPKKEEEEGEVEKKEEKTNT
ncbi:MAG: 30S ribosomal protein S1 [Candidatus Zixiibacteriota bacterium]